MAISYWESLTDSELDTLTGAQLCEAFSSLAEDEARILEQLNTRGKVIQEVTYHATTEDIAWLHACRRALAGKRGSLSKIQRRLRRHGIPGTPEPTPTPQPQAHRGRYAREMLVDMLDELARWDVDHSTPLGRLLVEAEEWRKRCTAATTATAKA